MAEIKANGDKMITCGDNIVALCDEYLEQVNNLFDSLSKINQVAWFGEGANVYASKIRADRSTYVNFGDYLKMYGKVIKNTGLNVNNIITKWEDKDK